MFVLCLCTFSYDKRGYGHIIYSRFSGIPVPTSGVCVYVTYPFFMRLRNISNFKLIKI